GLEGLRLSGRSYQPISPDEKGRIWSEQLGASFGFWHGVFQGRGYDWIRLFRPDGSLVPTTEELAEMERQRAEAERQRSEAAEAELTRLRALLEKHGQG
ncbi:MAG TPA: hypothetical protein VMW27_01320, partial [Thermoanaerobaculia bacterium]|nr:hypothetical protein [Thermoanaerobaculia bacterium]